MFRVLPLLDVLTLKAFANWSPGLLQPWEQNLIVIRRNSEGVASLSPKPKTHRNSLYLCFAITLLKFALGRAPGKEEGEPEQLLRP